MFFLAFHKNLHWVANTRDQWISSLDSWSLGPPIRLSRRQSRGMVDQVWVREVAALCASLGKLEWETPVRKSGSIHFCTLEQRSLSSHSSLRCFPGWLQWTSAPRRGCSDWAQLRKTTMAEWLAHTKCMYIYIYLYMHDGFKCDRDPFFLEISKSWWRILKDCGNCLPAAPCPCTCLALF